VGAGLTAARCRLIPAADRTGRHRGGAEAENWGLSIFHTARSWDPLGNRPPVGTSLRLSTDPRGPPGALQGLYNCGHRPSATKAARAPIPTAIIAGHLALLRRAEKSAMAKETWESPRTRLAGPRHRTEHPTPVDRNSAGGKVAGRRRMRAGASAVGLPAPSRSVRQHSHCRWRTTPRKVFYQLVRPGRYGTPERTEITQETGSILDHVMAKARRMSDGLGPERPGGPWPTTSTRSAEIERRIQKLQEAGQLRKYIFQMRRSALRRTSASS